MDSMDGEGLDAEADHEVDRIVTELTAGILAPAASAPESKIKRAAVAAPAPAAAVAVSSYSIIFDLFESMYYNEISPHVVT